MAKQWVFYTRDRLPEHLGEPREILGGKGASLRAMTAAGLPVPPAFVISTEACEHFFEHGCEWPEDLEDQVRAGLARLEADMERSFGQGARPLLVSVRSGAARSMPGMMDTLLNVGLHPALADQAEQPDAFWHLYAQFVEMYAKTVADMLPEVFETVRHGFAAAGDGRECVMAMIAHFERETGRTFPTTPWDLLKSCIDCVFHSWNNDRAVQYRKRNDIHGLRGTAVNVQAMFPSHVSGIVFTRDPTDLSDHLVIEASYGLGEAVVSGDVAPDRFIVDRDDFTSFRSTLGEKTHYVAALGDADEFDPEEFCLTQHQLHELCEMSLGIEEHFGKPMDIEFGLADGKFALLQSRAIRGLEILEDVEVGRLDEIARLDDLSQKAGREKLWVAHNLGETLRVPTPLTWDIMKHFMSGRGGFGRMYRDFGYRPADEVMQDGFLELICGRIYADPDRVAQLFWAGMPMSYDFEAVARDPKLMDSAPDRFDPERVEPDFLLRAPAIVLSMIKTARTMGRARKNADEVFEKRIVPPFLEYVELKRRQDLAGLSTAELIAEFHERRRKVLDEFGGESLKPGFLGGIALAELTGLLTQFDEKGEGASLAGVLTTALEGDITFEQDQLLYEVACGRAALPAFLKGFGHRCPGEMELMKPRFREDVAVLEVLMAPLRLSGHDPAALHHANAKKRADAAAQLPEVLAGWGASSFREQVFDLISEARRLLPYRERGKHYLMMGYELLRLALLALSDRWEIGNDVFFLRLDELERFEDDRSALLDTVAARRIRWQSAQRLDMADVVRSSELEGVGLPPERSDSSTHHLDADAIAAGTGTGPAAIVFDPSEAMHLEAGYILVCPSTDPGWTPLFINAGGLVVEKGGVLSHGAIVARDFGIPAVVCPRATSLIPPGVRIRVDGNNGSVTVLEDDHA